MYEEDLRPPPVAVRRDVTLAKEEVVREIRDASSGLRSEIEKHSEITGNVVKFHSHGFLDVFIPAFLAVVAGGYVVKYWL